jgi:hypothetical protein
MMSQLDVYTTGPDSVGLIVPDPRPCPRCQRVTIFWCQWIDRDAATITSACYECHARRKEPHV